MFVIEASCDACPRHCRAEIFRNVRVISPGVVACVLPTTSKTPAWRLGEEYPIPTPEIATTTAPPPKTTDRVLLACHGCSAPCLLEIQGPICDPGALRCQAGNSQVEWRRTL